ncbi:MAG: hypothetical protein K2J26_01185, partial [Ruminococcus sp.]|nr:hypothetical protein [Ruminococcus sp.]
LMILAVVSCGTITYGTSESFVTGIAAAVCVFVPIWGIFAVVRYAKINIFFKSSAVLAIISVWLFSAEKIALYFLPSNVDFSITISNDVSTAQVCAVIAGISVILASAGFVFKYHRK